MFVTVVKSCFFNVGILTHGQCVGSGRGDKHEELHLLPSALPSTTKLLFTTASACVCMCVCLHVCDCVSSLKKVTPNTIKHNAGTRIERLH